MLVAQVMSSTRRAMSAHFFGSEIATVAQHEIALLDRKLWRGGQVDAMGDDGSDVHAPRGDQFDGARIGVDHSA